MLLNCGVGEDFWESLGLQGDPVHPKGNQSWIFIGRSDAEAETPILWPPDAKNWLIWKDPDDGKDWRWEEKGMTEDEMAGWHHWLDGRESGWTPGVGDGQGGLASCNSWSCKESDTTERLNLLMTLNYTLFLWVPKPLHCDWSHEVKRHLLLGRKVMTNLYNICNQRHHFAGKGPYNQGMVFPSSRAWMWDLNHTEGWMPNNWCFRTVVLEKTLESLELKRDQTSQS